MNRRDVTDLRELQWTEDDASESVQLEFLIYEF